MYSQQLKLWLGKSRSLLFGTEVDWLRWMNSEGQVLELPQEQVLVLEQKARAEAERAEAEAQRANAEAQRAEAEAQRALQLEAELAALRQRLGEKAP